VRIGRSRAWRPRPHSLDDSNRRGALLAWALGCGPMTAPTDPGRRCDELGAHSAALARSRKPKFVGGRRDLSVDNSGACARGAADAAALR